MKHYVVIPGTHDLVETPARGYSMAYATPQGLHVRLRGWPVDYDAAPCPVSGAEDRISSPVATVVVYAEHRETALAAWRMRMDEIAITAESEYIMEHGHRWLYDECQRLADTRDVIVALASEDGFVMTTRFYPTRKPT